MKYRELKAQIDESLAGPALGPEMVIGACEILAREIRGGKYDGLLGRYERTGEGAPGEGAPGGEAPDGGAPGGKPRGNAAGPGRLRAKVQEAARLLERAFLEEKLRRELPSVSGAVKRYPLGVLLHIGAGNQIGLPAYSVVEGLLAGNINLLKLPEGDDGISSFLLRRLTQIQPALRRYVHVFAIPSSDCRRMEQLASLADGIAVWGGDEAVRAVRALAGPAVKLIEWGHRVSFAYVDPREAGEEELRALAGNMLDTDQLLCSSCQGIYLDTEDPEAVPEFCRKFLGILEEEATAAGRETGDIGRRARNTLRVQNSRLEAAAWGGRRIFAGTLTSVTWEEDPAPGVSLMYGNCWVKRLSEREILPVLRGSCGYLQTVALVCGEQDRERLAHLLFRAGAVRVCRAEEQSALPDGGLGPHDGEFPLARYSKLVI